MTKNEIIVDGMIRNSFQAFGISMDAENYKKLIEPIIKTHGALIKAGDNTQTFDNAIREAMTGRKINEDDYKKYIMPIIKGEKNE